MKMQITTNSRGYRFLRSPFGCHRINDGNPENDHEEEDDGPDYYADYCDIKAEENAN